MAVVVTSFDDVMERCRTSPEDIQVWFEGGITALERVPLALIRPLPFTIRFRDELSSDPEWILGRLFRQVILRKRKAEAATLPTGRNDELKNYFAMERSLSDIVRVCRTQGSRVIVGFEGGRSALRLATPAYLAARPWYKWDWVDRPLGAKDLSNWIPGDDFLRLLGEVGAL